MTSRQIEKIARRAITISKQRGDSNTAQVEQMARAVIHACKYGSIKDVNEMDIAHLRAIVGD